MKIMCCNFAQPEAEQKELSAHEANGNSPLHLRQHPHASYCRDAMRMIGHCCHGVMTW